MSLYTRRLIQLDFEMYRETDAYGKRHFIEPDFGVSYLVIMLRKIWIYYPNFYLHKTFAGSCNSWWRLLEPGIVSTTVHWSAPQVQRLQV